MTAAEPAPRNYLLSRRRRIGRHLRAHGSRALLGGTTATGVLAGFLSASDVIWPLLAYIAVAAGAAGVILLTLSLRARPRYGLPPLPRRPADPERDAALGRPPQLDAVHGRTGRRVTLRCDDPVYGAGLRV